MIGKGMTGKLLQFGFLLLGLLLSAHCRAVNVGDAMPICKLPGLPDTEKRVDFSVLSGKATLIGFWTTDCEQCSTAFDFWQSLHHRFANRGLQVLAVSIDDDLEAAERYARSSSADFTLATDPVGICPQQFQIMALPSAYLMDGKGRVIAIFSEFTSRSQSDLQQQIEKALP